MESKSSILIFDSNNEELMQIVSFMESDYELTDVAEGSDCLEKASTIYPDLILLDDMVSEPNCYDICQSLKSDHETHNIPIVLMSDLTPEELEEEIGYLGSDDYICKPIQRAELLEKVDTLLSFNRAN